MIHGHIGAAISVLLFVGVVGAICHGVNEVPELLVIAIAVAGLLHLANIALAGIRKVFKSPRGGDPPGWKI